MNQFQIKITDPSGLESKLRLPKSPTFPIKIGKAPHCLIRLKDITVLDEMAEIHCFQSESQPLFWIKSLQKDKPIRVGDLTIAEGEAPLYSSIQVGESQICIQPLHHQEAIPEFPKNLKAWETVTESGLSTLWLSKKAATTPLSIYLEGETGTGKEVLAHLIHAWSSRAKEPFIALNCGALPFHLAESELFGHIKGAYTGATHTRTGACMQAHGGTLFLDEVADLPLDIQVKLLRFLENGEIRPVGSDQVLRANVRVVCATHKSLKQLVEEGKFRRDLYFRLASVLIPISPLRERPNDIEFLGQKFSEEFGHQISPRALEKLKHYSWPGNVRELRHAIERASAMAGPTEYYLELPLFDFLLNQSGVEDSSHFLLGSILNLQEVERVLVIKALKQFRGNRSKAAKALGVARSTLFEMISRHELKTQYEN